MSVHVHVSPRDDFHGPQVLYTPVIPLVSVPPAPHPPPPTPPAPRVLDLTWVRVPSGVVPRSGGRAGGPFYFYLRPRLLAETVYPPGTSAVGEDPQSHRERHLCPRSLTAKPVLAPGTPGLEVIGSGVEPSLRQTGH